MAAPQPAFATFWAGATLSAYEAACLASFVRHGYALTVYSYGAIDNLPPGIGLGSAADIVDQRFMNAYLIKGQPSLSHFSDLFRYWLFKKTPLIWVDSDLYLLRAFDIPLYPTLLAREDASGLCGAIMRLDPEHPALDRLIERTQAVAGRNLVWGETGPRLLTEVFGHDAIMAGAHGPERFFPIHYDQFWKVFLPEYRAECEALCRDGYTLHLWNNIVAKVGIWKDVLPPEGSYLQRRFVDDGMGALFQGTFPADAMRHVVDNYRMRMSGNFDDVRRLAKLALPGLKRRTLRQVNSLREGFATRLGAKAVK
jgi:hypothetical protein